MGASAVWVSLCASPLPSVVSVVFQTLGVSRHDNASHPPNLCWISSVCWIWKEGQHWVTMKDVEECFVTWAVERTRTHRLEAVHENVHDGKAIGTDHHLTGTHVTFESSEPIKNAHHQLVYSPMRTQINISRSSMYTPYACNLPMIGSN